MTVPYCFIKIFTTNFQDIIQSYNLVIHVGESDFLPSLRQSDTHIERKCCFQKIEYDSDAAIEEKIYPDNSKTIKKQHAAIRRDA